MRKVVVADGPGIKRCAHVIGVGGLDNDNVDKREYIAACIAAMMVAGSYTWRHAWRLPILEALNARGHGLVHWFVNLSFRVHRF